MATAAPGTLTTGAESALVRLTDCAVRLGAVTSWTDAVPAATNGVMTERTDRAGVESVLVTVSLPAWAVPPTPAAAVETFPGTERLALISELVSRRVPAASWLVTFNCGQTAVPFTMI